MLKNLKNLSSTIKLSKQQQKTINGGDVVFLCDENTEGWQCATFNCPNIGRCELGICYAC